MEKRILGLHHVTAIAGNAKRNHDFYTGILGLRLVKKTVNFDDPGTYHFYFGDETGSPGTLITFFPWEGMRKGSNGSGMVTDIGFSVPAGSGDYWIERFKDHGVRHEGVQEKWGETCIHFQDPDGLELSLVVPRTADPRRPWLRGGVAEPYAIRGFSGVTLTIKNVEPTLELLTSVLGYTLVEQSGHHYRLITDAADQAAIVDIKHVPDGRPGINAAGTNHHVAFRVRDEKIQMEFREKIEAMGLHITPKIDRDYFFSVYFREPGGVLFEIATENPGFTVDEPLDRLGSSLKLPAQFESSRSEIENLLPKLS